MNEIPFSLNKQTNIWQDLLKLPKSENTILSDNIMTLSGILRKNCLNPQQDLSQELLVLKIIQIGSTTFKNKLKYDKSYEC
jgi:hypothetical protein